jgi:hypothetical protein
MLELLRTHDPLLIARVTALLEEAGIDLFVADASISAMTGSIGAFPQRLLVPAGALDQARQAVIDIGLAHELPDVS